MAYIIIAYKYTQSMVYRMVNLFSKYYIYMPKTLWNTIKIEVPEKMVNITKNDNVTMKNTLTKNKGISKTAAQPSIKLVAGDVNKPKIISSGKEWNISELKIRMKKAKDLSKKNEGKEYKKKLLKIKHLKLLLKKLQQEEI